MRVLHIISSFGRGGAPALIVSYMLHLCKAGVYFDFLLRSNNNAYSDIIDMCGGKVYKVSSFPRHLFSNVKQTYIFLKHHTEYDVIHIHCNALIYIIPAILGKIIGKKVVIHSHNTKSESCIGRVVHYINRLGVKKYSDYRFACSDLAGQWCFKNDYTIIKNAVDPEKFFLNSEARKKIREELGLVDNPVFLHVGRMEKQKNHDFLLQIFKEIKKKSPDSVLLLMGSGSLEEQIRANAIKYQINKSVLFLGVKENVNDYLSASDVMLFPSLWEGLPVSLVEAQYASLKVLCSDAISKEVLCSPYIKALSLGRSAQEWAEHALELYNTPIGILPYSYLDAAGYNIKIESQKLADFYLAFDGNKTHE